MAFKMKGFSGFKHKTVNEAGVVTHGGGPHGHTGRPDSDNPGQVFTDEEMIAKDESGELDYYVSNVEEEEKEVIPEGCYYIDTGAGQELYCPPKKKKTKRGNTKVKKVRVRKRRNPQGKLMDLGY